MGSDPSIYTLFAHTDLLPRDAKGTPFPKSAELNRPTQPTPGE